MLFQEFTTSVCGASVAVLSCAAHGATQLQTQTPALVFATVPCSALVDGFAIQIGPVFARLLPACVAVEIHGQGDAGHVCVMQQRADAAEPPNQRQRLLDGLLPIPPTLLVATLLTHQLAFAPSAVRADDEWPALLHLHQAWQGLVPTMLDPVRGPPTLRAMTRIARAVRSPVPIDELAESLSVSRPWLAHSFLQQTGLSLHAFRKHLRIRMAACELLQRPVCSTELATRYGYAANSQFTIDFASVFRTTPSRLIRALTARLVAPAGVDGYRPRYVSS